MDQGGLLGREGKVGTYLGFRMYLNHRIVSRAFFKHILVLLMVLEFPQGRERLSRRWDELTWVLWTKQEARVSAHRRRRQSRQNHHRYGKLFHEHRSTYITYPTRIFPLGFVDVVLRTACDAYQEIVTRDQGRSGGGHFFVSCKKIEPQNKGRWDLCLV